MPDYAVVDPATGKVLATYPNTTDTELGAIVTAATQAQRDWAGVAVERRASCLRRVAELHRERREDLAHTIVREIGKPVAQALGEVDFAADIYEYYADTLGDLVADTPIAVPEGLGTAVVRRAPLGLILGIMPWNYPYYQVARFAAPNVAVGNAVLLKPAPQCPESSAEIADIFALAGFTGSVYTNIFASNDQVADIIADPRVRGVSLTGSERAGVAVAEAAARSLKKVVLELGGSDPFLLLSTDDLDATVAAAVAARLENSGQACNAAKRFIVIDDLYEPFVESFSMAMASVVPADPALASTELGPLASSEATARLETQLQQAVADGARVVVGGKSKGNFFAPTVIADVSRDNRAHYQEFFGPVAIVYRALSEEDAIAIANDTPFGLGSYVFTTDPLQAARVADALEAGMVYINIVGADAADLPFGGVKRSGFGRELGAYGADEFVNKKLIRTGKS
jgi:succinate-semialdehyde dehydrogenase/glutarate-semialdehyde dehydrogenase